jgi:hypothetical protein
MRDSVTRAREALLVFAPLEGGDIAWRELEPFGVRTYTAIPETLVPISLDAVRIVRIDRVDYMLPVESL